MGIFNLGDDGGSEIKGNVKCAHGRVEWLNLLQRGGAGVPDTREKKASAPFSLLECGKYSLLKQRNMGSYHRIKEI